jgi:hypothetical protein
MRTRNEKIFLAILIGILLVAGNYYGYQWLSRKQATLDSTYAQLRADKTEAEVDLKKEDIWAQRKAWVRDHEPAMGEEGDTKAQVLLFVTKGAKDNKLEVLDQNFNDVQHGPAGTRINVTVRVKGSMEGLCHWLADLQKPESFYAVSSISLNADQDQKSMICKLQVTRFFKGGS